MIRKIFFIIFSTLFLVLSSCVSRKEVVYFQNLEQVQDQLSSQNNNIKIKPDDVITIKVFAPRQEAAMPFNLMLSVSGTGAGGGAGGGGGNQEEPYMVSNEGTIDFPILGQVEVAGLSSLELAAKLKEDLQDYVKDPIVNVRILNFQVSVLGEVGSPGTFTIQDDHISLPKLLGMAGDIPLTGKRKEVLVMREENGSTTHAYLDLTDAEVINSPFYNLQQNDVVYVEPNALRRQSAGYLSTVSSYLGLFSTLLSLFIIFTR